MCRGCWPSVEARALLTAGMRRIKVPATCPSLSRQSAAQEERHSDMRPRAGPPLRGSQMIILSQPRGLTGPGGHPERLPSVVGCQPASAQEAVVCLRVVGPLKEKDREQEEAASLHSWPTVRDWGVGEFTALPQSGLVTSPPHTPRHTHTLASLPPHRALARRASLSSLLGLSSYFILYFIAFLYLGCRDSR